MTPTPNPRQSRFARDIVRASAVLAVAVFTVTVVSAARSGPHASAAGTNAGTLQVQVPPPDPNAGQPLLSGVQTTPFALVPPAGAACTGDSATGGYRVNSYIVPASVNPGTLQWGSTGPTPAGTGANLSQPLFSSSNSPFVNMTTAVSTGQLTGLPPFSFAVFGASGPAVVPPGTYNLGLACTLGVASPTQEDKYWNVQMTFGADANGLTWIVGTPPPPTTTTTSTTTTTTTTTRTTTSTSTTTTTMPPTTTSTTTTTTHPTTTTTTTPPTTTSTTTTTTPPTTTSPATTTTAAGGTTTTVPRDDDCHARPGERHGHPHSERCREPKHDQPPHHRYMRMRIWMW